MKSDLTLKCLFAGLITGLLMVFCSIENPQMPVFESNLTIPVTSKIYAMRDLANDSKNLMVDQENRFGFCVDGKFDTIRALDILKFEDALEDRSTIQFGSYTYDLQYSFCDSVNLDQFWPGAGTIGHQQLIIPGFDFSAKTNTGGTSAFADFRFIRIDSGYIHITITNHLPVPLGLSCTLLLKDLDISSSKVVDIGQAMLDSPLFPGTSVTKTIALAGKTITPALFAELCGRSSGSNGNQVQLNSQNQAVIVTMKLSQLSVKNSLARLPALPIDKFQWLQFDDPQNQVIVHKAKINSGRLHLKVRSFWNVGTEFMLTIEHFRDINRNTLKVPMRVADHGIITSEHDLSGWFLSSDLSQGPMQPRIKVTTNGLTNPTGLSMVSLAATDTLSLQAILEDIKLDYMFGIVNRVETELDSTSQGIDLNYDLPNFEFKNTEFHLNVYNRIAFPLEFNLSFNGYKKGAAKERFDFQQKMIDAASIPPNGDPPTEKMTKFLVKDPNFDRLLNSFPDRINVLGTAFIGRPGEIGYISKDDYVFGTYALRAPFEFTFEDTTINFDTTWLKINPPDWESSHTADSEYEIDGQILNDVQSGKFQAFFENKLPISTAVTIRMDTSEVLVFGNKACAFEKTVGIRSGEISAEGLVTQAKADTIVFELAKEELDLFKNRGDQPKTVVIGILLQFSGSNGQFITIQADDFIAIRKSYLSFVYRVHD